jgi:DNA-binding FadR family transcriptional regulator
LALTDDAITSIKQMILSGQVGPGEKLPREKELATRLQEIPDPQLSIISLETMSLAVDLMQNRTLVELFEVRRIIEPAATALAAGRIDKEDLRRLEETLGRMDAAENVEELVEADDDFHRTVAGATGNAALAALLQNLYGRTLRARIWRGLAEEGALDRTRISHRAIYGAISNRDAELARSAATMHIAEVEAWFRRLPEVAPSDKGRAPGREAQSR